MKEDVALLIVRLLLGGFFVLYRFRFFYDPSRKEQPFCNRQRHESLTKMMQQCGWTKNSYAWACFVAVVELFAGLAIIVGLLTTMAAFGLLVVTLVASFCTAKKKVFEQNPVDGIDCVSCYLWRVEGLYIALALVLILLGPGRWSIDYWFFA